MDHTSSLQGHPLVIWVGEGHFLPTEKTLSSHASLSTKPWWHSQLWQWCERRRLSPTTFVVGVTAFLDLYN